MCDDRQNNTHPEGEEQSTAHIPAPRHGRLAEHVAAEGEVARLMDSTRMNRHRETQMRLLGERSKVGGKSAVSYRVRDACSENSTHRDTETGDTSACSLSLATHTAESTGVCVCVCVRARHCVGERESVCVSYVDSCSRD